jgi:MFS family permease
MLQSWSTITKILNLAICRICEPIAFMSVFPYAYHMVESFHVANGKNQISLYVGMITSAFAFAECASSIFWGRLSDRIGRKTVLLGGLLGTGLSMLLFGLSRNLTEALIFRALGGLLNGQVLQPLLINAHQQESAVTSASSKPLSQNW